jgi:DNA helicase-2/ATP-dependent DNA helicase PcrA
MWWPEFESNLKSIQRPQADLEPKRSDREILEEVLELVRTQAREPSISWPQDEVVVGTVDRSELRAGVRVRHAQYGVGVVLRVDGEGDKERITVSFPGYGQKKFVAKLAKLDRIEL